MWKEFGGGMGASLGEVGCGKAFFLYLLRIGLRKSISVRHICGLGLETNSTLMPGHA